MHRLNELVEKLTESELQEVERFAELLLSRQTQVSRKQKGDYLDLSKVAGILAGVAPEKTSVELAHEATEARAAKYGA